jgi:catechol 2,3-dioxygenase-like lactoylglutathione lyase family enzyme
MQVRAFRWAGVRATDFDASVGFFRDVLGLSLVRHDADATLASFRLPSGHRFEVFGPASVYFQLHEQPAVGFEVDDVVAARRELEAAGVEFAFPVVAGNSGDAWTYFRGPDGVLYELTQAEPG